MKVRIIATMLILGFDGSEDSEIVATSSPALDMTYEDVRNVLVNEAGVQVTLASGWTTVSIPRAPYHHLAAVVL